MLSKSDNLRLTAKISMRDLSGIRFCHSILTRRFAPKNLKVNHAPFTIQVLLLKLCRNYGQLLQVQSQWIVTGYFPFWSDSLLKRFSNLGHIAQSLTIFRYINSPDTLCTNCVIKAYSISSIPEQAVVFYFERLVNGFSPISYTFVSLFGCCAKMGSAQSSEKYHAQVIKYSVDSVQQVQNSMVHVYGNCGAVEFARKVFDEMPRRDLVSRNSIMDAYASNGHLDIAHKLYDAMLERNVVTRNILIHGYLKGNNPGCSLMPFRKMMKNGEFGNDKTKVSVLSACGKSARLKEGRSAHGFLVRTLLNFSLVLDTSLIDMYSKCQKVEPAQKIFDSIVYRNVICWNPIITGHCIHGNPEDGLDLFAEMVNCRDNPR